MSKKSGLLTETLLSTSFSMNTDHQNELVYLGVVEDKRGNISETEFQKKDGSIKLNFLARIVVGQALFKNVV